MRPLAVLVVAAALLAGCTTTTGTVPRDRPTVTSSAAPNRAPSPAPRCAVGQGPPFEPADRACLRAAARAGAAYLGRHLGEVDPTSLLVMDYLYRRWHVAPLASARTRALRDPDAAGPDNLFARLFGRDRRTSAARREAAPLPDRLMASVLDCEHRPLSGRDVRDFKDSVALGGVPATHALWVLSWARELGCVVPAGMSAESAETAIAAELAGRPVVDDLGVEQGVYLTAAGAGSLVDRGWPAKVVAAQLRDGAWYSGSSEQRGGQPDWHTTALAVWYLMLLLHPDADDPGLVP